MVEERNRLREKGVIIKDQRILFYAGPGVYFGGEISRGLAERLEDNWEDERGADVVMS